MVGSTPVLRPNIAVAGRLLYFKKFWFSILTKEWVKNIVYQDYMIIFKRFSKFIIITFTPITGVYKKVFAGGGAVLLQKVGL